MVKRYGSNEMTSLFNRKKSFRMSFAAVVIVPIRVKKIFYFEEKMYPLVYLSPEQLTNL